MSNARKRILVSLKSMASTIANHRTDDPQLAQRAIRSITRAGWMALLWYDEDEDDEEPVIRSAEAMDRAVKRIFGADAPS